jgi:hypothetical protein
LKNTFILAKCNSFQNYNIPNTNWLFLMIIFILIK